MGFLRHAAQRGAPLGASLHRCAWRRSRQALHLRSRRPSRPHLTGPMGLLGILVGLGLLIFLSYRGWSVLLVAPLTALIAAIAIVSALIALAAVIVLGSIFGSF